MKKCSLLVLGLLIIISVCADAQIYYGDIILSSQSQVDAFINSGITEIHGVLAVQPASEGETTDITNLDSLTLLTFVSRIVIAHNPVLTDIGGLSNIDSLTSDLQIESNGALLNLDGLSAITTIGGNVNVLNTLITNLDSFSSLTSVGGNLFVQVTSVTNLDGLSNLVSVGGKLRIFGNPDLTKFCGLYTLLSSDGLAGEYDVSENAFNPAEQEIIDCGPCSGISQPTAYAGPDEIAVVGGSFHLDGSGSTDPASGQLSYFWSFISKPSGSTAVLIDDMTVTPALTPDLPGDYVIRLIVSNGCAASDPDLVTINAISLPEAIQDPIDSINHLPLNSGNKNALISKLQNALAKYNAGDLKAAKNILMAYINQLQQFVSDGTLTSAQAQPLIDFAYDIIDAINSMLPKVSDGPITQVPSEYSLSQNYPNPFNPSTTIRFSIPEKGYVQLKVYDVLGKEVANLVDGNRESGYYEVNFDGSRLASGLYIYKLSAGNFISTKKMLMIK